MVAWEAENEGGTNLTGLYQLISCQSPYASDPYLLKAIQPPQTVSLTVKQMINT